MSSIFLSNIETLFASETIENVPIRMKKPLIVCLSALALATAAQAARPNIVLILADDMGYGDVQALNPKSKIPTPHLNRLAREGMTFTDAHSPSAVCTPTRYGVVTGRYCWRSRLKRGVLNGYGSHLIDPKRETLARFLSGHGYHSAVIGKWHLGMDYAKTGEGKNTFDFSKPVKNGANDVGFDHSYIIPASLDFPPYYYIRNQRAVMLPTMKQEKQGFPAYLREGEIAPNFIMEEALDHLTDQAVGYLRQRSQLEQPFFLYFPLTAPHKPVLPHKRFRGKTKLGPYGDFVVQVDDTVGRVLKALDEFKLADNTVVFYTSDNGSFMHRYEDGRPGHVADETVQGYKPENHTANGPLRGTKADVWEAGHRVPFFVRWPGKVRAGSKSRSTITHTDFYATCAEIVRQPLPADAAEDSFSLLAPMLGKPRPTPRAPVINHSASGMFAIRDGKWKLVLGNGSGGRQQPKGKPFQKPYHLFDLDADLGERTNVAEQNPELVERLIKQFERIHKSKGSRSL